MPAKIMKGLAVSPERDGVKHVTGIVGFNAAKYTRLLDTGTQPTDISWVGEAGRETRRLSESEFATVAGIFCEQFQRINRRNRS